MAKISLRRRYWAAFIGCPCEYGSTTNHSVPDLNANARCPNDGCARDFIKTSATVFDSGISENDKYFFRDFPYVAREDRAESPRANGSQSDSPSLLTVCEQSGVPVFASMLADGMRTPFPMNSRQISPYASVGAIST